MGGRQSTAAPPAPTLAPAPAPVQVRGPPTEDPYPTFEKGVDGIKRETAEGCKPCNLSIPPNLSVSSVEISREAPAVTPEQLMKLWKDREKVETGQMQFCDLKKGLETGSYYFGFVGNPELGASQFVLSDPDELKEIEKNISSADAFLRTIFTSEKRRTIRRLRISQSPFGNFSAESKLSIKPTTPLKFSFNGNEVLVTRMTLYHPCPVRVNNIQYDAVLSLNDPLDENTTNVLLIPIKGELFPDNRATFFSNIVPHIARVVSPNPNTGSCEKADVPTGSTWNLTTLIPTKAKDGVDIVTQPFFVWNGGAANYQRSYSETEHRFRWIPTSPQISYFMMENPVPINSLDLQTVRRLPITRPNMAIHPVPNKILYQPPACTAPKKKEPEPEPEPGQTGAALKEDFEDRCDPFAGFADQADDKKITSETIFNVIIGILSALAVFIGVYFAVKFAASERGGILKKIGDKIGKAIGGAGIKAMQKAAEGVAKAAETTAKTAETTAKAAETAPPVDEVEARLSKSLTTEKPTEKPTAAPEKVDKKVLKGLTGFKAPRPQ
jgi:hypothetical protein